MNDATHPPRQRWSAFIALVALLVLAGAAVSPGLGIRNSPPGAFCPSFTSSTRDSMVMGPAVISSR